MSKIENRFLKHLYKLLNPKEGIIGTRYHDEYKGRPITIHIQKGHKIK